MDNNHEERKNIITRNMLWSVLSIFEIEMRINKYVGYEGLL